MASPEPLRSDWVERIFTRLLVRYGPLWSNRLPPATTAEGLQMIDLVKQDWALQLAGMSAAALQYCLDNLPADFPPATVSAFKEIARGRPTSNVVLLEDRVQQDPARLAEHLKRLAEVSRDVKPLDWAEDLRRREKAGEKLTPAQRAAWRSAVQRYTPTSVGQIGQFNPPPVETLPPGMRPKGQDDQV